MDDDVEGAQEELADEDDDGDGDRRCIFTLLGAGSALQALSMAVVAAHSTAAAVESALHA